MSHPTRGAWIEIDTLEAYRLEFAGRTLPGVRGLKLILAHQHSLTIKSHPTRGAWIEIRLILVVIVVVIGRTLPGVRGLK